MYILHELSPAKPCLLQRARLTVQVIVTAYDRRQLTPILLSSVLVPRCYAEFDRRLIDLIQAPVTIEFRSNKFAEAAQAEFCRRARRAQDQLFCDPTTLPDEPAHPAAHAAWR